MLRVVRSTIVGGLLLSALVGCGAKHEPNKFKNLDRPKPATTTDAKP